MRVNVEGWLPLPHSYGITAQFLTLELLTRSDLQVSYQAIPYPNSNWHPVSLLPQDLAARWSNCPSSMAEADLTLKISHLPNLVSETGQQPTLLFAVTPWGVVLDSALSAMGVNSLHHLGDTTQWIAPSNWSRDGLLRSGATLDQIRVIPLGVDPQLYQPLQPGEREALRRQLGWGNQFVFLTVGSLDDCDGIRPLLKAFAQIVDRYPDSRLVLKGCDALYASNGYLIDASQSILDASALAKVQPRLAYLGTTLPTEQLVRLYQAADAYVSPYLATGFNLPVLEAMACGLPVICTAGGPTDDFIHPDFGLKINSTFRTKAIGNQVRFFLHPDWEHLASLMGTIMNQPDFCNQARQIVPEFAAQNYTWKQTVNRLIQVVDNGGALCRADDSLQLSFPVRREFGNFNNNLQPQKSYSLLVEGWRQIPHSYALINCCQLLEFLDYPQLNLFHKDMPYVTENWKASRGLFSEVEESLLDKIPTPEPEQVADVTLRMYCPFDLSDSVSSRTVMFGCTEWGVVPKTILRGMNVESFRQAHLASETVILTASHWSGQGFVNSGADPTRVVVVPLGFNPQIYRRPTPEQRQHLRQQLGWQDDFVFLNIGVMWNERQGVDRLLKAFAQVTERYPKTRLVLKGRDAIFPSHASIQKASKNVLSDTELERVHARLHYIGHNLSTQEMAQLYQAADVYVSPYSAEGFNLPVLEASACGLPIICTAGGPTEDFTHSDFTWKIQSRLRFLKEKTGDTKLYLEPNQEHLIELMFKVIEESQFRRQAAQIGPEFVVQRFTWTKVVSQLLSVLYP